MNLTISDLEACSSPFEDWQAEFLSLMQDLSDFSGSEDELLVFLFNDVLPFVKHQYTLYDTLIPLLSVLEELLDRRPDSIGATMDFLAFLFQEPIRESMLMLVEPVQYRYLRPQDTAITAQESHLFNAAKRFYESRRMLLTDHSLLIYHDLTLLDSLHSFPAAANDRPEARLSSVLAAALKRYRQQGPFIQEQGVELSGAEYSDLCAALQGRSFDEDRLYQAVHDEATATIPWAGGRLGTIAGLTLFMASSARGSQATLRTLQALVEHCAVLKQSRTDADDGPATTDQFLLEDLSVALFRKHLAATKPLLLNQLKDEQRLFIELLQQVYQGHTYALLYAGILPPNAGADLIGLQTSIYDLTD